jgi:hypothetical protein
MRSLLTVVVGALLLLAPHRASAEQIEWFLYPASLVFGLSPATEDGVFRETFVDHVQYQTGTAPFEADIAGEIDFITGPLLDLSVVTDAFGNPLSSVYHYGPGELSIAAHWLVPGGVQTVTFLAPLLGLTIDVRTESGQCQFGTPCADALASAVLGPGLFDPAFAQALGILGPSIGGSFAGHVDRIDGTPSSVRRFGGAASPWEVDVNVPEPTVNALLLSGAAALWIRRRHRTVRP